MLRKIFIVITILSIIQAVNAERAWVGIDQVEPAEFEVLFHSSEFTEIEFDIKGVFISPQRNGDILFSLDGIVSGTVPNLTRMVAIPPYKNVEIQVISTEFIEVDYDGHLPAAGELFRTGEPVIIRDLRAVPFTVFPLRRSEEPGRAELLRRARIRLNYSGYSAVNNKTFTGSTSKAFENIYNSSIINYNWLDSNNQSPGKGTYLIITPEEYTNYMGLVPPFDEFVKWKKSKGYQVEIHIVEQTGTTCNELYDLIQAAYQSADPPLEYVLLVGDPNGGMTWIPTHMIEFNGQTDPTDHPYSTMDDDDYFSDVLVGRLSVSSYSEALIIYNKIVHYEKNPYMQATDWYKSMLAVAGNYDDTSSPPITPCQTAWWMADYFLDHGFTTADTILNWGPWDPTPGNYLEILASIDEGKSFVVYRGWGDANGWQVPAFNRNHINLMDNDWKLPVFGSFVCNTGNFTSSINPCFGEKLLRVGGYIDGDGAVAFYGPSDLYTNTNFNNAISSGFCEGFWEAELHHFGAAAAYSKAALYQGFPNKQAVGDYAWFYFHVYNCLGDPEMEMWNDIPIEMEIDCPSSLPSGVSSVEVSVDESGSGLENAYVTVLHDDELIAGGYTDSSGEITLTFDPAEGDELTITATNYGYIPAIAVIPITSTAYIGYISDSLYNESNPDGCLNPGETADLYITIENFGAGSQNSVSGVLSTANPYISISGNPVSFGNVASGATSEEYFTLIVDDNSPSISGLEFTLDLTTSSGSYESKFAVVLSGSDLAVYDVDLPSGPIFHGMQKPIAVTLINNGDFTASDVSAIITSLDPDITVIQGNAQYGDIPPGQTASNTGDELMVEAAQGTPEGKIAQMQLSISPSIGGEVDLSFNFIIGTPDETDPTGPDAYGYYAYDDGDIYYQDQAPTYDWVELDPNYPGHIAGATPIFMGDDSSTLVDLPFDFVFYGDTYDQLTICTNGWVSFTETWMANFRNWDLPSPLGPHTLVAAFWDDLKDTVDTFLDIYYWEDPAGRFIIEWSRVHNRYKDPDPDNRMETFELILYDPDVQSGPTGDGDILIQFKEINDIDFDNNFSTVGIEDYWHSIGLEYIFSKDYENHPTAAELHDEMAILITTTPPENFSGVEEGPGFIPQRYTLWQNYPNPFNASTRIDFELAEPGMTELKIFDVSGRLIKTLISGELNPGGYSENWNGADFNGKPVSSGVYFIRLESGEYRSAVKCIILK